MIFSFLIFKNGFSFPPPPPGEGRYSIYPLVGRCSPAPHTLTLFLKTKIAEFPTLFKAEFRSLIPCLGHLTRNHTLCKTIINKNFAVSSLVRRTYAQAVYRPRKDTLFKTKIDKIDTLFKTKIPKNIPWLAARPH